MFAAQGAEQVGALAGKESLGDARTRQQVDGLADLVVNAPALRDRLLAAERIVKEFRGADPLHPAVFLVLVDPVVQLFLGGVAAEVEGSRQAEFFDLAPLRIGDLDAVGAVDGDHHPRLHFLRLGALEHGLEDEDEEHKQHGNETQYEEAGGRDRLHQAHFIAVEEQDGGGHKDGEERQREDRHGRHLTPARRHEQHGVGEGQTQAVHEILR